MVRDEEMINNKYKYLMSFIHNIFNRKKNKVCIVLYSKKEGSGKSILCKLITNILGNMISSIDNMSSISIRNFNKILSSNNLFYCLEEFTQKEVAEKLGISQSYISRIEKKVIRKLKQTMKILKGILVLE